MQQFIGFTGGPMLQNVPLRYPNTAPLRRFAQLTSGALRNIDGMLVPYNPYIGACNMNNVPAVVANPCLRGTFTHLGAVATAPQFYV